MLLVIILEHAEFRSFSADRIIRCIWMPAMDGAKEELGGKRIGRLAHTVAIQKSAYTIISAATIL